MHLNSSIAHYSTAWAVPAVCMRGIVFVSFLLRQCFRNQCQCSFSNASLSNQVLLNAIYRSVKAVIFMSWIARNLLGETIAQGILVSIGKVKGGGKSSLDSSNSLRATAKSTENELKSADLAMTCQCQPIIWFPLQRLCIISAEPPISSHIFIEHRHGSCVSSPASAPHKYGRPRSVWVSGSRLPPWLPPLPLPTLPRPCQNHRTICVLLPLSLTPYKHSCIIASARIELNWEFCSSNLPQWVGDGWNVRL